MANETIVGISNPSNDAFFAHGFGDFTGDCAVGNNIFNFGTGSTSGALRFQNVGISHGQSINFCRLVYKYAGVGGASSGSWKHTVKGIDEDNTASFSSGNPLGRSKTSASITINEGRPTSGGTKEYDVRSIVQEIVNRGGWSSGNAIGITFEDNGTDSQVGAYASMTDSYLVYRISAEPNFKPTPKSVSAPSLPTAQDYGIRISKPGQNVLTATEQELYYSSRRDQLKVYMEGEVSITSSTKTITHNFGYTPFVMLFIKYNGYSTWEKYPSVGTTGYYVNDSVVYIDGLANGDKIYYYIFIDELD